MKTYLVSFSTLNFEFSQELLDNSAIKFGINGVYTYRQSEIKKTDFYRQNKVILDAKKGAGYCLWKPYIILETLEKINEGDVVVYCDSGLEIIAKLDPLYKLCIQNKGIILFENDNYSNRMWTKRDTFVYMDCDNAKYWNGKHVTASIQLYEKNETTIKFLNDFLKYCKNPNIITDKECISGKENFPEYKANRYDQSVLSLLAIKYDIKLYRDPTQWGNYLKKRNYRESNEFHHKNYVDNTFKDSNYTTLFYHHRNTGIGIRMGRIIRYIRLQLVMNNPLVEKLSNLYRLHIKNRFIDFSDSFRNEFIKKIKYQNFIVFFNKGNTIARQIELDKNKIYEPDLSMKIEKELSSVQDPILFDIGANIGLISLYVLARYPITKIYAFEPGPLQSDLLKRTIKENSLRNICIEKIALSDKKGKIDFFVHSPKDIAGDGFIDTKRSGPTKKITVPTTTLDAWISNKTMKKIDVIKIDTEGAELLILKGGQKTILKYKPNIFLEISLANLKVYSYDHFDIFNWFADNGYNLFSYGREKEEKITKENYLSFLRKVDTFVARPDKK